MGISYLYGLHKVDRKGDKKMENQIITMINAEGNKISGYKIRTDEQGQYIKRFGMKGRLVKSSTFSPSGKTEFIEYIVSHYS